MIDFVEEPPKTRQTSQGRFIIKRGEAAGLIVISLRKTCEACPAQWEGEDAQGREVYIRYRGARGYVQVAIERGAKVFDGEIACSWYREDDNGWDGTMGDAELRELVDGYVVLP